MAEPAEVLSLEQAAEVLKVGVPTVQSLINRGLLAPEPDTSPPRIAYAALVAFLKADQLELMDEGGHPPGQGMFPPEQAG